MQPGHYMCLGDNSAYSSDSREWGVVPERLMLGKAVFVFFPVSLDWKLGWPPVRFNPLRTASGSSSRFCRVGQGFAPSRRLLSLVAPVSRPVKP